MDYFDRFLALFSELHRENVDYVLVGGVAVNLYGVLRNTQDIDLFIRPERDNVERLKRALHRLWDDPDIEQITVEDLAGDFSTLRYGPPDDDFYVDLLSRLGAMFAYDDIESTQIEVRGVPIRIATPEMLVRMKRDTVRAIDKADAALLREHLHLEED